MTRERLKAFGRRTVAHNRQPHRLVALPFQLIVLGMSAYAVSERVPSTTFLLVTCGIGLFSMVLSGLWWFMGYVLAGYRAGAPKPK